MIRAMIRESVRSAASQKVATLVTLVLVAGMCIAVLLTSGKAEGNRQAVLATIDTAGTRSIVIKVTPEANIDSTILTRFSSFTEIQSAVAFGSARDVRNSAIPGSDPVPLRDFWGAGFEGLTEGEAIASSMALEQLGMKGAAGAVSNDDGVDVAVVGLIHDASAMKEYEPLLLRPRHHDDVGAVGSIVIVAQHASQVGALLEAIRPIVVGENPNSVSIDASQELAALQGDIDGNLGNFQALLVAGVFIVLGGLVALAQTALVMLKRKDWGRRRALGASRSLISLLVITQTGIISLLGAVTGAGVAFVTLLLAGDPAPSWRFVTSVVILAVSVSLISSALPAFFASRRDPIRELRVP